MDWTVFSKYTVKNKRPKGLEPTTGFQILSVFCFRHKLFTNHPLQNQSIPSSKGSEPTNTKYWPAEDKDKLLTKIYVLAVATLVVTTLFASYNFVFKPEAPYLSNGRDTLWDTQTEELADEICVGCDTDEEKVQAFYQWIIQNFEYDYECNPLIQYFDVRKTLRTKQGLCFDFAHLFAAFCRSQNIPCYAVDGISRKNSADRHTWNRVYFDGSWWNLDITADNSRTANGKELYGFHELECAFVPDEDFFITKIY